MTFRRRKQSQVAEQLEAPVGQILGNLVVELHDGIVRTRRLDGAIRGRGPRSG